MCYMYTATSCKLLAIKMADCLERVPQLNSILSILCILSISILIPRSQIVFNQLIGVCCWRNVGVDLGMIHSKTCTNVLSMTIRGYVSSDTGSFHSCCMTIVSYNAFDVYIAPAAAPDRIMIRWIGSCRDCIVNPLFQKPQRYG